MTIRGALGENVFRSNSARDSLLLQSETTHGEKERGEEGGGAPSDPDVKMNDPAEGCIISQDRLMPR